MSSAFRSTLADAYLQTGRTTEAAAEFVRWLELVGVEAAERDRARAELATGGFPLLWSRLAAAGAAKKGQAYKTAAMLAGLGRHDDAPNALNQAFADRESQLLYLNADPFLDPLRSDRRFAALVARARISASGSPSPER